MLIGLIATMQVVASRFYAPYRSDLSESDPYLMIWGPWVSVNHYWDYFIVAMSGFLILALAWFYCMSRKFD